MLNFICQSYKRLNVTKTFILEMGILEETLNKDFRHQNKPVSFKHAKSITMS